jgi:hypothetical protein
MFASHRVKIISFPPHSIHIFQKGINDKLPLKSDETTAGSRKRIFRMMMRTLIPDNVRSSFIQMGLQHNIEISPDVSLFDKIRGSLHFGKLTIPWRNHHIEEKARDLDGLLR